LQLLHTYACGPFRTSSLGGSKFFLTFIDDKSRRIRIKFVELKKMAERQKGKMLKCSRSDNGTDYVNKAFDGFLKINAIIRQLTTAYTPQQNAVAERANRTLVGMSRCLLLQSGLCEALWAEAIYTAVYLRNRSPTSALTAQCQSLCSRSEPPGPDCGGVQCRHHSPKRTLRHW